MKRDNRLSKKSVIEEPAAITCAYSNKLKSTRSTLKVKIGSFKLHSWDERRDLLVPGDETETIDVCVRHFITTCRRAIEDHGAFYVALSGGSTPKAVIKLLTSAPYNDKIDWKKVWLFWGDERSVPPTDPESNFKMAMDAGLAKMPIPKEQIFRMKAEEKIEINALAYETTLKTVLEDRRLDLVILGMGEDGHTASLFPQTEALKVKNRIVVANYVPQKNTWRMTLTYEAINAAQNIVIYVLGASKKETVKEVFRSKEQFERYPIQLIGTKNSKALWILDSQAASELIK
ncbi:MAG: 6-phosphogluconolactonase [Verrucomicrobia bacterium]|nr:6-phosphogluconolactonase [Verrucomicrobiota bacterium]